MYKKIKKFVVKPLFAFSLVLCISAFAGIIYASGYFPDSYSVLEGNVVDINSNIPVKVKFEGDKMSDAKSGDSEVSSYNANINLLGIFPVKKVSVSVIKAEDVLVMGNPFGIKIYTDGVLVVKIASVDTEKGKKNPAKGVGIKVGDYILTVSGERVSSNEDVARLIEKSNGQKIAIKLKRDNKVFTVMLTPALSYSTGKYKAGIWVKDSSAGIGTLTFYSPAMNVVCGLGHAVCEEETGNPLQLESGRLISAEILGVDKGTSGTPGGLVGKFTNVDLGELVSNNETGVYATTKIDCTNKIFTKLALKHEVVCGNAQILCTVDDNGQKLYNCEITKINYNGSISKNISIRITDEALIEKTGGIVQGMSGSPIIQNGKLVGAVTHVLVDDPTRGYGIFAENMLESAESVAEKQLKKAS